MKRIVILKGSLIDSLEEFVLKECLGIMFFLSATSKFDPLHAQAVQMTKYILSQTTISLLCKKWGIDLFVNFIKIRGKTVYSFQFLRDPVGM